MLIYPYKPLNTTWLKASVIGSLWAAFEIIVGSFLHNLHLPFSGTFLGAFSVFLLIAFFQVWDDKGVLLRAGIICALMKSLSPSAVILGPMIGIFTEALIIWLMIAVSGKNLIAYILGGSLAVASALLHKIVSLLILYGLDLVKIFEGVYYWAAKQLRMEDIPPGRLILGILLIYLSVGGIAALLGYLAGKRYRGGTPQGFKPLEGSFTPRNELFSLSTKRHYSILLLISHLIIIIICLWLLNKSSFYIYLPASAIYLTSCSFWYRKSLQYFKKIGFWLQFFLITFIAAFLLESYSAGQFFSWNGLIIGLKMNLRAIIIMVGFTAISAELKNPLIRSLMYDKGLANLYQSLSLAFSALPEIVSGMPGIKLLIRERKTFMNYLFNMSDHLLARFDIELKTRPDIIIITGDVGAGKTTFVEALTKLLIHNEFKINGFTAPGIFSDGTKKGFFLRDLSSHHTYPLASKTEKDGWIRYGHYYFDTGVIRIGNELLVQTCPDKTDLVVIDEVGPLEMSDQGWAPAVDFLCREIRIPQLWVVRKSLVKKASRKWNVGDVYVFDIKEVTMDDVFRTLLKIHSKKP